MKGDISHAYWECNNVWSSSWSHWTFTSILLRDGGDCTLVDVEDGIVKLQLHGACGTCPSSTITLKAGIERALHEEVPGVIEVEQVF